MFKEVDDIVRLGKWAYLEIPTGNRCKGCPLLGKEGPDAFDHVGWYCKLRSSFALIHDEEGPFKDDSCPAEKKEGS